MLGSDEPDTRHTAGGSPAAAWCVPLPGRRRIGALHREGEVAALEGAELLPERARRPARDVAARRAGRRRGDDRHGQRGRSPARGAEPRQAPSSAVQRPSARRQVLPVHRGDGRRRVPARDVHPRASSARGRLLRTVRQREEGARDPRRPQSGLQVPSVRGAEARQALGDSVPRLPHRPLSRAVRRLHLPRGLWRDHLGSRRVPVRRDPTDPARAGGAHAGRLRRGALRGCGALPKPSVLPASPRRAPDRGRAEGGQRRRRRRGGRRRARRRPGLSAPRRQAGRPLQLPARERGGPGRPNGPRSLLPRVLRPRSWSRPMPATRSRSRSSCRSSAARGSGFARPSGARNAASWSSRSATRGSRSSRPLSRRSARACGGWRRSRSCGSA
jgi:hypothetical protein